MLPEAELQISFSNTKSIPTYKYLANIWNHTLTVTALAVSNHFIAIIANANVRRFGLILKGVLTSSKGWSCFIASPRCRWCLGEYSLGSYNMRFYMKPANIRPDASAILEKLITNI